VLINIDVLSQSRVELKNNFYYAESRILFEDYKEALPSYLTLLKVYPTNANFKYRIGQCYINTSGEKEKAIRYLEDAVKNIDPDYKEGSFRETGAPYDALYYLANAYRINNQLDKALETYELFKKNLDPSIYDTAVVNLQIQSCINAKDLMKKPLYIKEKNLGDDINDGNSEFNPVVSDDENTLVFSKSEAFYDAILYSTRKNGKWSAPVNMNELLKVDRDIYPTSLSNDGKELYLYSSAEYDGIIYTTKYVNGTWTPLVKLNDNINTKYWESHATISHDGKNLYFTSNRKGTYGGLDIYVSGKDSVGDWGPAVNLGPVINTPYNEESPFLSKDDKTLFFSSRGHFNMGGYDVFYSTKLSNGEWSVPLNAGYPVNSTDDDVFFKPLNDGYEGYYAKDSHEGFGKQDIYRIEIFSKDHPRKFYIKGLVTIADLLSNFKDSIRISARNTTDQNQTLVVFSNPLTGQYEFELPQGDFQITYEGTGAEKMVRNLNLPLTSTSDSFILPGTTLTRNDFSADLYVESNKTISVVNGDTIVFPLKVEPGSLLTIEHWVGDSLMSVEKHMITDSTFVYKMAPANGENKIVFKLTDRFNNTTSSEVYITREKGSTIQTIARPEYSSLIAKKQISALASIIEDRSEGKLHDIVKDADLENKQFAKVDDLFSYLRDEAARKGIDTDEVGKLALRIALMDNILSQAAVDYMAKHTDGELKKLLSDLNVDKENLKTWADLQEYVKAKTGNRITPDDLNRIATAILAGTDPSVVLLKNKILAYSEKTEAGNIIRQAVATVDLSNIRIKEKWLKVFYDEAVKQGLTPDQLAELMASISSLPETTVEQFLKDLIRYSEEPLTSALKSINLKQEHIKTPKDLILYLMKNKDKLKYSEDAILKALSEVVAANNVPGIAVPPETTTGKKGFTWLPWVIILSCLFLFFFFKRKKDKDKKKK